MNAKIHITKFGDLQCKYFELAKMLSRIWLSGNETNAYYRAIFSKVKSFYEYNPLPVTKDGYRWFCSAEFKMGKAKLFILFPWMTSQDGVLKNIDRYVNIYSTEDFPEKETLKVCKEVCRALR